MKQTIAESFYILIHHPVKPRVMVPETIRDAGMIGAVILDLSLDENLILQENLLKVMSTRTDLPFSHKILLDKIYDSPKKRKPKAWISRFVQSPGKIRRALLENLEKRSVIELVPRRFLFIPYTQTWLIKRDLREKLIRELRAVVFDLKEPDNHSAALLGLIHATKMYKLICSNSDERKKCRSRIPEIISSDVIIQGVGKVIQEMQAAMTAAIVASAAATPAVTASS